MWKQWRIFSEILNLLVTSDWKTHPENSYLTELTEEEKYQEYQKFLNKKGLSIFLKNNSTNW